jgi:hypothetical protein
MQIRLINLDLGLMTRPKRLKPTTRVERAMHAIRGENETL